MAATGSRSGAASTRSSTPRVASSDSIAGTSSSSMATLLGVEVEGELRRMRAEPDEVDLVLALVVDPGADQLLAEDTVLRQELVIGFERVERLAERARHLRDVGACVLEQVVVRRRARVEPALDPVDPGHQHRREGEVRV